MLLYWRRNGQLDFTTDVEDWMSDHNFTEVFAYASGLPSEQEMEITQELDNILAAVRYGRSGISATLKEMGKSQAKMVSGPVSGKGQQSRGAAEGTAVDEVFKEKLTAALNGRLKRFKPLLTTTPRGARGADVVSHPLRVAWDVTTVDQVWMHVKRDVFGKRSPGKPRIGDVWDRYYLLVWDEPRTDRRRKVEEIEAGRLRS